MSHVTRDTTRPERWWRGSAALAAVALAAGAAGAVPAAPGERGEFVLVRDDLSVHAVRLAEIGHREVVYQDASGTWKSIENERCLALFDPEIPPAPARTGLLELTDGQRLPGQAISNGRRSDQAVAWNHPWLGRLDVPLSLVRRVRLLPEAPDVEPGDSDAVILANGDRQEGFVLSMGDPISLEVEAPGGRAVIDLPLHRVAAVAIVAPRREPAGRRVWLRDGTKIDVKSIRVGDDGLVRLTGRVSWLMPDTQSSPLPLEDVAAMLFEPGHLVPLAGLTPTRVEGPDSRYAVPAPRRTLADAPLDLAPLELSGPMTVHFAVPAGAQRFAARAVLPESARRWGDFDLIVRDQGKVVLQERMNGARPEVEVGVSLTGGELTIELTEGLHGPIQDTAVLHQAMLLVR